MTTKNNMREIVYTKNGVKELVYTQNGVEKTVSLMLPNDLIKMSYGKSSVTLTLSKEDIDGIVAIAYDYINLKKAGISVRTLISSSIKKQHENEFVPKKSFKFLGVNVTYNNENWYINDIIVNGKNLTYNVLLRALLDYSIGVAMQK